ncbi:MAG: hypothetical protein AAF409_14680 [Pseudomonadota bacterium]
MSDEQGVWVQFHTLYLKRGHGERVLSDHYPKIKAIFQRHEFRIVTESGGVAGDDDNQHLYFLLFWNTKEAMRAAWGELRHDQDWVGLQARIEADEGIIRTRNKYLMKPHDSDEPGDDT